MELYRQALRIDKCCEWANLGLVNSLCLARNDREVVRAVGKLYGLRYIDFLLGVFKSNT